MALYLVATDFWEVSRGISLVGIYLVPSVIFINMIAESCTLHHAHIMGKSLGFHDIFLIHVMDKT